MNRLKQGSIKRFINYFMVFVLLGILGIATLGKARADESEVKVIEVTQSLMAMSVQKDVSVEDAVTAMKSVATATNMKFVGRKQVSKELGKRGKKVRHLEVLQFCNPEEAVEAVEISMVYAAYIPCQITMVEDKNKKIWLITRNMDMMVDNEMISPRLAEIAIRVNQAMLKIMTAGVTGEF